ncbi:MAG: DMP19 family protein [Polyangiales bacterium]
MTASVLRAAIEGVSFDAPAGGFRVGALRIEEPGVWVELATTRSDGRGTEGSLYLFGSDRVEDPRAVPFVTGLFAALRRLIERGSPKWANGYLDVRMPIDVLEIGATSDQYRDQFLSYPWLGRLFPERPAKAPPYVRAPERAVTRSGALDLDALFAWVYAHAQRTYDDPRWDDAMIRALPEPVRVLEGLHLIDSMVGGNGFEVFLAQARGAVVRQTYAALEAAGAEQLRELMAAGIGLAAQSGAEFMQERAKKWLEPFEDLAADDWSEIDGHEPDRSYALLGSELRPSALRFAERHRDALVR